MTETEQLADVIALSVHAATEPLLQKIATLEARPTGYGTKEAWEVLTETIADLRSRLISMEARPVVPVRDGRDGKDADLSMISELRTELASVRGELLSIKSWPTPRDGENGTSVTVADVAPLIAAEVTKAVSLIPTPQNGLDGKSVSLDDIRPLIAAEVATIPKPSDGVDGKSVDLAEVDALVAAKVGSAIAARPVPLNGKDGASVTVADLAPVIVSEVQKAVAAIPTPKDGLDGKSVDPQEVDALITKKVTSAVAAIAIPLPKDGTSVTLDDVRPLIQAEVAKIPTPTNGKDGQSVTLDDVAPLIAVAVTKAFEAMPKPKDGIGIKSAVVNNDGRLLLTLSDDEVKDLGVVVGKPGLNGMPGVPGRSGLDGKDGLDGKQGSPGMAGKDGRDGLNGKDGLGFEDLDVFFDEHKGWFLSFRKGTQEKQFPLAIPFDAKVWQVGKGYPKGAGVTLKGAWWIAQKDTTSRPGDPGSDWRLAVKAGQDGKPGPAGRDGSSL